MHIENDTYSLEAVSNEQLAKGIKHEMKTAMSLSEAKQKAICKLVEDPDYYEKI